MRRLYIFLVVILLFFGCVSCGSKTENLSLQEVETEEDSTQETSEQEDKIFVQVSGAVIREGVYELPSGSRVFEAIAAAGGLREDAAVSGINQAQVLVDEVHIHVPTVSEKMEQDVKESGKVNINQASKETLMTLPGVGESRAESIIQYRKEQGRFQKIEDIMLVEGIKEGLFEKIKDLITV